MRLLQYSSVAPKDENEKQLNFLRKASFNYDSLDQATRQEIFSINSIIFQAEESEYLETFCYKVVKRPVLKAAPRMIEKAKVYQNEHEQAETDPKKLEEEKPEEL